MKIYINGVLAKDSLRSLTILILNKLLIGSALDYSGYWDGIIDDVGIWNRALTAQEVQELYNSQSNHSYAWSNGETTRNHQC